MILCYDSSCTINTIIFCSVDNVAKIHGKNQIAPELPCSSTEKKTGQLQIRYISYTGCWICLVLARINS